MAGVKLDLTRVVIVNNGGAVQAGDLHVEGSIVSNNRVGVSCGGTCIIRNSIIANNGDTANTYGFGGLEISPAGADVVLEFNTIANNLTAPAYAARAGIYCVAPLGLPVTTNVRNNVVVGNLVDGCTPDYSLFDLGTTVTGHNRAGDAKFKSTSGSSTNPAFYRIGADSAAIDGADPTSTTSTDIDGDGRPQGAGFDIGADEHRP